jgi:hypothetical protein
MNDLNLGGVEWCGHRFGQTWPAIGPWNLPGPPDTDQLAGHDSGNRVEREPEAVG